jgi:phage shock protein E
MRSAPLLLIGVACAPEAADSTAPPAASTPIVTTGPCAGVAPVVTVRTPDELDARLQAGDDFWLINVHIPYEGEIAGTDAHVVYTDTDALEALLAYDHAADALLYCKTGPMSAQATADLVARGYCNIQDLPVGMAGWEAEGYPLLP